MSRHLPPAILAIGRNYAEHAKEMGGAVDPNPIIFMKNPASVIRDGDAIEIPPICREHGPQVDFEGELAFILGRDAKDVPEDRALSFVPPDGKFTLRVPGENVVAVSQEILSTGPVADITIEDVPLEDVIAELFAAQA